MLMRVAAPLTLLALTLSGCDKKLDRETAKRLIAESYGSSVDCTWNGPNRSADKEWVFISDNEGACGDALAAAGLISMGGKGGPFGMNRHFEPSSKVKMKDRGQMEIPCGRLEVTEVVSITTEEGVGNKADVTFKRAYIPDDVYYPLCFLLYDYMIPGAGTNAQIRIMNPRTFAFDFKADVDAMPTRRYTRDENALLLETVVFAHELIHAWRMMAGRRVVTGGWEEEAMTTGMNSGTTESAETILARRVSESRR